ncbi:MAG: RecX family transcriptional regulator [Alphaproteobacteria bacterium]|nr:RecX family transcriptional regulator [Alphaproteobacteria bacterium]
MPKPRRKYRRPTLDYLANSALYYLSRYAASEASLRRVLDNKIRRAIMQDEVFAADHEAQAALRQAIDKIVETHIRTGVINDAAFAEMKVHSLRRAGRSARMITLKLSQKGLKPDVITKALLPEDEGEDPQKAELRAAQSFAKRRALGPYRKRPLSEADVADSQAQTKQTVKDVTTLARAGFSFDVAKKVLDVDFDEDE